MVVHHHQLECPTKQCVAIWRPRSRWQLLSSKYECSYYIFWTESFATKLSLMVDHHDDQGKYWVAVFSCVWTFTTSINICFKYLLNCNLFCNQTWYDDAPSSAGVSCKNIRLTSLRSRSQASEFIYGCFCYIFLAADRFASKFCLIVQKAMWKQSL